MATSKLTSHFNPRAGVSIVLPQDWVEQQHPLFDAMYLSTFFSQHNPHLAISRFKLTDAQPGMQHQAAQESPDRNLPEYTDIALLDTTVDNYPATLHTYGWYDAHLKTGVIQQFVYVQIGDWMVRMICSAHKAQWLRYSKVFEEAINSIRFIF